MQNLLFSTNELSLAGKPSSYRDNKHQRGIRGLFIFVKVGARSPRSHLFGLVSEPPRVSTVKG